MSDCNQTVVALPVTDVKLGNGNTRRGVQLEIGQPAQTLATLPGLYGPPYETTARNVRVVESKNPGLKTCLLNYFNATNSTSHFQGCRTLYGGTWDQSLSTTWFDPTAGPDDLEHLELGDKTFDNFTIVYLEQASNTLPMGSTSDLLDGYLKRNIIGTKSWGYDQGITGGYPPEGGKSGVLPRSDGLLTLGGYDGARFMGEPVRQDLDNWLGGMWCQIVVEVARIVYKDSSGGGVELDVGTPSKACIDPTWPFISITAAGFQSINNHEGNRYSQYGTQRITTSIYRPFGIKDPYPFFPGNLTITLTNGFSTTIPNSELSVPHVDILESGQLGISTSSTNVLRLVPKVEKNPIMLGQPFLAAAYMYVNYDNNSLFLARPARMGSSSTQRLEILPEKPSRLIPLLPSGCTTSAGSIKTSDTVQKLDADVLESNSSTKSTLSKGALAGIIVGSITALVLTVALIWFFVRRRKQAITNHVLPSDPSLGDNIHEMAPGASVLPHEMMARHSQYAHPPPLELSE